MKTTIALLLTLAMTGPALGQTRGDAFGGTTTEGTSTETTTETFTSEPTVVEPVYEGPFGGQRGHINDPDPHTGPNQIFPPGN